MTQIAFSVGLYFRAEGRPRAEIPLINADGSGYRPLVSDESNNEAIPQPYGELFVIRRDETGMRQLTDNHWEGATRAWKPVARDRRLTVR